MKREYWALFVFVLITVLEVIGPGFHGQTKFIFFIIILEYNKIEKGDK